MNIVWTILSLLAALGAAWTLYEMNYSRHGVPGLKAFDDGFRLPDMRFHYGADTLFGTLDALGAEGRDKLMRLWRIDFAFIACLLGVMLAVGHNIGRSTAFRAVMDGCAVARAALDALENALLMRVTGAYPERKRAGIARAAGYVTSAKFIALIAWVVALFLCLGLRALGVLG